MSTKITGPLLVKLFLGNNIHVIKHLDILIPIWENAFFTKHDPHGTADAVDLLHDFFSLILTDPVDLRIVNDFVYFQRNNIMRMSLAQFSDTNNELFLLRWFLMFARRVEVAPAKVDYTGCLVNAEAELHFPRIHIVARYVCLAIRRTVCANQTGTGFVMPYNEDAWNYCVGAASLLLRRRETLKAGKLLLDILYNRLDMIIGDRWQPESEVYPLASKDEGEEW